MIDFNNDEERNAYALGVKEGKNHSLPSPETIKLLSSMQKQIDYIVKTIDETREEDRNWRRDFGKTNKDEHEKIITRLDKTNGNVKKNTEYRLRNESVMDRFKNSVEFVEDFKANLNLFKLLLGFVGVSNIIVFIKLIIR